MSEFAICVLGGMFGYLIFWGLASLITSTEEHPSGIRCHLKMCGGRPISKWGSDGHLWHAWQCEECGQIKQVHRSETVMRK